MSNEFEKRFPVIIEQPVHWGDMDAFEHVNNVVYFRYFEDARIAYFEETGVIAHKDATSIGPILASTQCNFKAPLTYPDTIKIGATIEELAEKRFVMHYAVWSENQQKIAAEGEGLVVYYDYEAGKSCPVPDVIVENIHKLQKAL